MLYLYCLSVGMIFTISNKFISYHLQGQRGPQAQPVASFYCRIPCWDVHYATAEIELNHCLQGMDLVNSCNCKLLPASPVQILGADIDTNKVNSSIIHHSTRNHKSSALSKFYTLMLELTFFKFDFKYDFSVSSHQIYVLKRRLIPNSTLTGSIRRRIYQNNVKM